MKSLLLAFAPFIAFAGLAPRCSAGRLSVR